MQVVLLDWIVVVVRCVWLRQFSCSLMIIIIGSCRDCIRLVWLSVFDSGVSQFFIFFIIMVLVLVCRWVNVVLIGFSDSVMLVLVVVIFGVRGCFSVNGFRLLQDGIGLLVVISVVVFLLCRFLVVWMQLLVIGFMFMVCWLCWCSVCSSMQLLKVFLILVLVLVMYRVVGNDMGRDMDVFGRKVFIIGLLLFVVMVYCCVVLCLVQVMVLFVRLWVCLIFLCLLVVSWNSMVSCWFRYVFWCMVSVIGLLMWLICWCWFIMCFFI